LEAAVFASKSRFSQPRHITTSACGGGHHWLLREVT
jgi:hypothetical protein